MKRFDFTTIGIIVLLILFSLFNWYFNFWVGLIVNCFSIAMLSMVAAWRYNRAKIINKMIERLETFSFVSNHPVFIADKDNFHVTITLITPEQKLLDDIKEFEKWYEKTYSKKEIK